MDVGLRLLLEKCSLLLNENFISQQLDNDEMLVQC